MPPSSSESRAPGAAFLLTQLGTQAARRFAERIEPLGITPPHAGILRLVAMIPDCSQQKLATRLGILPSRMVVLIDEMAGQGLLDRRRSATDRRNYEIVLTDKGAETLANMQRAAAAHDTDFLTPLTPEEQQTLKSLCEKLAAHHGLAQGVHPGYKHL
ncbi:MarR family transcriptional regulator [Verrucomicrobium sp. BvORR106]|uniref:MarR family winged helix-turn-helix transcriptional regulator n=1 Tax=Verrucomicrobium sp. BvORR106 TaxID=1403819 RepID=UPI000570C5D7|nr:MarR family transcriptional regulator [Verrucomicrobium sp. BvORR106]